MTLTETLWCKATLPVTSSIQEAIRNLDDTSIQIVLIVDEMGRLEGTLSDGDIRRGLLRGLGLDSPIKTIVHSNPLVVPEGVQRHFVLQLMSANKIRQIPIVDQENKVIGLYLWEDLNIPADRPNTLVVMAGGKGTRLRPYTESCPKPMLHVAGKPMLEHIIERAKLEGFRHFVFAIHYLGHMVEEYFGDGSCLGVQISYLREDMPLGTAGALSLLSPHPELPFVVTNGDVITDIRYGELLDFHNRYNATATMAVRMHEWQHPFGVVKMKGVEVIGFEEKPVARSHINAGVYVLMPEALSYLEKNVPCDMPTLFEKLQAQEKRTVAYPMHEPWLDVGRPNDLAAAQNNFGRDDS